MPQFLRPSAQDGNASSSSDSDIRGGDDGPSSGEESTPTVPGDDGGVVGDEDRAASSSGEESVPMATGGDDSLVGGDEGATSSSGEESAPMATGGDGGAVGGEDRAASSSGEESTPMATGGDGTAVVGDDEGAISSSGEATTPTATGGDGDCVVGGEDRAASNSGEGTTPMATGGDDRMVGGEDRATSTSGEESTPMTTEGDGGVVGGEDRAGSSSGEGATPIEPGVDGGVVGWLSAKRGVPHTAATRMNMRDRTRSRNTMTRVAFNLTRDAIISRGRHGFCNPSKWIEVPPALPFCEQNGMGSGMFVISTDERFEEATPMDFTSIVFLDDPENEAATDEIVMEYYNLCYMMVERGGNIFRATDSAIEGTMRAKGIHNKMAACAEDAKCSFLKYGGIGPTFLEDMTVKLYMSVMRVQRTKIDLTSIFGEAGNGPASTDPENSDDEESRSSETTVTDSSGDDTDDNGDGSSSSSEQMDSSPSCPKGKRAREEEGSPGTANAFADEGEGSEESNQNEATVGGYLSDQEAVAAKKMRAGLTEAEAQEKLTGLAACTMTAPVSRRDRDSVLTLSPGVVEAFARAGYSTATSQEELLSGVGGKADSENVPTGSMVPAALKTERLVDNTEVVAVAGANVNLAYLHVGGKGNGKGKARDVQPWSEMYPEED